ncbi:hypothetical protein ACOSQ3_007598 [Xanthoceras sorbifolium]
MNRKQKNKEEEEEEDKEINNLLLTLMEDYSDSVIPPLSDLSHLHEDIENKSLSSRKRCRDGDYKEEMIQIVKIQKDRRDIMKENFNVLQTMVPNLFPKASRERILDETISHIEFLKKEVERLEEKKNSSSTMVTKGKMSMYSNLNSSINVTVSGNVFLFRIQTLARHRMVTEVFMAFHKHGAEVLASNVVVNHGQLTLIVTAFVDGNKDDIVEKIKRDVMVL